VEEKLKVPFIPRPLVTTNQIVIVLSVITSLLSGSKWFLLIPLFSGLGGLLFDFNPVMKLASKFLRKKPNEYIPEDKEQQQFNQTIAVVCLAIAFIGALLRINILFYIFSILVGLAATIAICGFCIGCFIHFQWNQYKYRRNKA